MVNSSSLKLDNCFSSAIKDLQLDLINIKWLIMKKTMKNLAVYIGCAAVTANPSCHWDHTYVT